MDRTFLGRFDSERRIVLRAHCAHPNPELRSGQPRLSPRLHLVLGDSIARRAVITSRFKDDRVLNRGRTSDKWDDLLKRLDAEVKSWQTAAAAQGLIPGTIVIWLTGNELYGELSWYANWTDETLFALGQSARAVVARLRPHADKVLVFGPLPRPAGEAGGEIWGKTAAFHAE